MSDSPSDPAHLSTPAPAPRGTMPARLGQLGSGLALGAVVGVLCGAASALFLILLDRATSFRVAHPLMVLGLPLAGLAMGLVLERHGEAVRAGTGLVISTLRAGDSPTPPPHIPARVAPMILFGTIITHLFGGSAGREGTAVQMGASLAENFAFLVRLPTRWRWPVLQAGIAGGFGAVFGTPVAGAVFALELGRGGALSIAALVPCLAAALVGDHVTRALGVVHTVYPAAPALFPTPLLLCKWLLFAIIVALVALSYVALTDAIKRLGARVRLPLRMAIFGALVAALAQLPGAHAYLGLGVPTIERAFVDPGLPAHAFAAKLGLTALTIGGGFLGGEVTPLFFAGATLGNLLSSWLDLPLALGAGVGLAAIFGAAAHTPLALAIMAAELMGVAILPHAALVTLCAHRLVARGIYPVAAAPEAHRAGRTGTGS